MPLDPTIAAGFQAPQIANPLQQFGQFAGTANALSQNRLMGQYLTNAQTENQEQQLAVTAGQLQQAQARSGILDSALAPLMRLGSSVTPDDIYGAVNQLHAAGVPTDGMIAQIAAGMPTTDPAQLSNPSAQQAYGGQLQKWITNTWGRSLSPETQARVFTPSVSGLDTGSAFTTYDANPITNPNATRLNVPLTMTPGQQVTQVPGPVGPNGQPTVIPQGDYAAGTGYGRLAPGSPGTSVFGTGRLPPALRNPANSGGAGAPPGPAPIAPGTPMQTGLGPGQVQAMTGAGHEGETEADALTNSAQDSPARQAQLEAMLGDLTKFGSGPNSPAFGTFRAGLVQLGLAPTDWTEGQSAQENFTKMSNQFLARQASALGPVTNDKLALASESGPNPLFTRLGNQGVLHIAQGNEDALTARNQAWLQAKQTQGLTGENFQNWSTNFNRNFAPSAFWYARMSPPERQTFIAGMTPQQRQSLFGNIQSSVSNGWIDPSTFSQQGGANVR